MGFDNDKRARSEMLSYLKLHRLHSSNIVRNVYIKFNLFEYSCKLILL